MKEFVAWMDAHSWVASILGSIGGAFFGALFGWLFGTRSGKKSGKAAADKESEVLKQDVIKLQNTVQLQAEKIGCFYGSAGDGGTGMKIDNVNF